MASTAGTIAVVDPFAGFPAILGLRDLRRALNQTIAGPLSASQAGRLLALDPLALIRALRVANAPVQGAPRHVGTVPRCIQVLGGAAGAAFLQGKVVDLAGTQRLRALWLHSLSTAYAAAALAQVSGEAAPEEAYVAGLLHDLAAWLECIHLRREGVMSSHKVDLAPLVGSWNLPAALGEVLLGGFRGPAAPPPSALMRLALAAEHMAEMEGFLHPDTPEEVRNVLSKLYDRTNPEHTLTRTLTGALAEVGLDLAKVCNPPALMVPVPADATAPGTHSAKPDLGRACSILLEFTRAEKIRTIYEALVGTTQEFLRFDRVWLARWSGPGAPLLFRVGADPTPGPLPRTRLLPSRPEVAFLSRLLAEGAPGLLIRLRDEEHPLLDHLGADQVLAAPLAAAGAGQAFLLADRALRGQDLWAKNHQDLQAICGLASMALENLLAQRRAWRHGHTANMDSLTGLLNRRAGLTLLARLVEEFRHTAKVTTLLLLDLDDFKLVNDTWGHRAGDEVLRMVARALLSRFGDIGTVHRIGGEEFLVLLAGLQPEEAIPLVEEVRQAVAATTVRRGEVEIRVTVSIGVTATNPLDETVEDLVERADRALYASKARGKNRFSVDLVLPEW